jgi:hypothetical protein
MHNSDTFIAFYSKIKNRMQIMECGIAHRAIDGENYETHQ